MVTPPATYSDSNLTLVPRTYTVIEAAEYMREQYFERTTIENASTRWYRTDNGKEVIIGCSYPQKEKVKIPLTRREKRKLIFLARKLKRNSSPITDNNPFITPLRRG